MTTLGREEIAREAVERLTLFAEGLEVWRDSPLPALHPDNYSAFAADLRAALSLLSALSAQHEADRARIGELEAGVRKAADWFADYERQHRAKGTADADVKANVNAERAEFLAALLNPEQSR